jgi:hypothetical protein
MSELSVIAINLPTEQMIGRIVLELTRLPQEDLPLVIEFVTSLKERRPISRPHSRMITDIMTQAEEHTKTLAGIPHPELVARFQELTAEIRQTAIAKGTTIEGDWTGD